VIKDVLNLAYQPEQVTIWWVAIGIGVVVDLVVIALLNLLTRFVTDIDEGSKASSASSAGRPTTHRRPGSSPKRPTPSTPCSPRVCSTTSSSPGF
jgi:hypothetical protein